MSSGYVSGPYQGCADAAPLCSTPLTLGCHGLSRHKKANPIPGNRGFCPCSVGRGRSGRRSFSWGLSWFVVASSLLLWFSVLVLARSGWPSLVAPVAPGSDGVRPLRRWRSPCRLGGGRGLALWLLPRCSVGCAPPRAFRACRSRCASSGVAASCACAVRWSRCGCWLRGGRRWSLVRWWVGALSPDFGAIDPLPVKLKSLTAEVAKKAAMPRPD